MIINKRNGFVLLGFGLGLVLTVESYSFRRAIKPKQVMNAPVQNSERVQRGHGMRSEALTQSQQTHFGSGPDLAQPAQGSRWGGVGHRVMPVKQPVKVNADRNSRRRSLRGGMPHESGRIKGEVQQQVASNQSMSRQDKLSQAKPSNSRRSFRFLNKKPGTNPLDKRASNHNAGPFHGGAVYSPVKPVSGHASAGFFESFGAHDVGERRGGQGAIGQESHSRANHRMRPVQPGFGQVTRGTIARRSHQGVNHPQPSSRKAIFHNPNEDLPVKPYRGEFYTQGGRAFAVDPGLLGRWKAAQSSR